MAASEKEAQRIRDAAQKLLAADADFREASWSRIRQIAEELSVKKLRGSERRAYARELNAIAAVNLQVAARLGGTDDARALRQVAAEGEGAPHDPETYAARLNQPASDLTDRVARDSHPFVTAAGVSAKASQAEGSSGTAAVSPSRQNESIPGPSDTGETLAHDKDNQAEFAGNSAAGTPSKEPAGRPQRDSTPSDDHDEPRHAEAEDTLPSGAGKSARAEDAAHPANPNYDERGRWIGDTAPVNVVQMLNVERVYQSDDEDDKDRYAAAAAQASLYDDPVAVVLPSAEELEAILPTVTEIAAINGEELKEEVEAEREEQSKAPRSDTDRTPVAEKGTSGAPGAGGQKPADPKPADGEPSISFGVSEHSRAERAILADKQRKEAKKARKRAKKEARRKRAEHQRASEADETDAAPKHDSAASAIEAKDLSSGATPKHEPGPKEGQVQEPDSDRSDPTEPILGKHAGASANHQPAENRNTDDKDSAVTSAASHDASDHPASGAHTDNSHAGRQGHEDETVHSDDADDKADTEADDAAKSDAAEQKPSHKRRFKLFGHREDDLPVIPRGKATVAPDDFLVIDKHRAAQSAARAQREASDADKSSE